MNEAKRIAEEAARLKARLEAEEEAWRKAEEAARLKAIEEKRAEEERLHKLEAERVRQAVIKAEQERQAAIKAEQERLLQIKTEQEAAARKKKLKEEALRKAQLAEEERIRKLRAMEAKKQLEDASQICTEWGKFMNLSIVQCTSLYCELKWYSDSLESLFNFCCKSSVTFTHLIHELIFAFST